jgi:hypothetical protein
LFMLYNSAVNTSTYNFFDCLYWCFCMFTRKVGVNCRWMIDKKAKIIVASGKRLRYIKIGL